MGNWIFFLYQRAGIRFFSLEIQFLACDNFSDNADEILTVKLLIMIHKRRRVCAPVVCFLFHQDSELIWQGLAQRPGPSHFSKHH